MESSKSFHLDKRDESYEELLFAGIYGISTLK